MSAARPQLTPAQKLGAEFMLAELRRLYLARLEYLDIARGLIEVADAHALAWPPAFNYEGATDSLNAIAVAIDEWAGMIYSAEIVAPELPALKVAA